MAPSPTFHANSVFIRQLVNPISINYNSLCSFLYSPFSLSECHSPCGFSSSQRFWLQPCIRDSTFGTYFRKKVVPDERQLSLQFSDHLVFVYRLCSRIFHFCWHCGTGSCSTLSIPLRTFSLCFFAASFLLLCL